MRSDGSRSSRPPTSGRLASPTMCESRATGAVPKSPAHSRSRQPGKSRARPVAGAKCKCMTRSSFARSATTSQRRRCCSANNASTRVGRWQSCEKDDRQQQAPRGGGLLLGQEKQSPLRRVWTSTAGRGKARRGCDGQTSTAPTTVADRLPHPRTRGTLMSRTDRAGHLCLGRIAACTRSSRGSRPAFVLRRNSTAARQETRFARQGRLSDRRRLQILG